MLLEILILKVPFERFFPGGSESACNIRYTSSIPGSARSPAEGNGNPLQYSFLENPMDKGAWRATVHRVTKSYTWLKWPLLVLLLLSHFSRVQLCATHRQQLTRHPHPWDSPSKNTRGSCHFLLQCMRVKSESEVAQSCLTLRDPMDCSLPGSSVHGSFQARVLEWGAIAFSD